MRGKSHVGHDCMGAGRAPVGRLPPLLECNVKRGLIHQNTGSSLVVAAPRGMNSKR
jgi:hypothetical protein